MENEEFDGLLRELRENVTEIDNPPASELEQGLEWRECKRCGHPYTGSGRLNICPACMGRAIREGREDKRKARAEQKTRPFETCLVKKKEDVKMPIETRAPEERKPAETCPNVETVSRTVCAPASAKPTGAAQRMVLVAKLMETVEHTADEWGMDVDTVIDTINDAFGIVRAINIKSKAKGGAVE